MPSDSGGKNRKDILREITDSYAKEEQLKKEEAERARGRMMSEEKYRIFLKRVGMFALVLLSVNLIVVLVGQSGAFEEPRYWAPGKMFADSDTEACIGNMWKIRKAIDRYYAKEKISPDNMQVLYDGGFLDEKVTCPASGKEYVFKKTGGETVFACPEPGKHGFSKINCDVESGAPVVERNK